MFQKPGEFQACVREKSGNGQVILGMWVYLLSLNTNTPHSRTTNMICGVLVAVIDWDMNII